MNEHREKVVEVLKLGREMRQAQIDFYRIRAASQRGSFDRKRALAQSMKLEKSFDERLRYVLAVLGEDC